MVEVPPAVGRLPGPRVPICGETLQVTEKLVTLVTNAVSVAV